MPNATPENRTAQRRRRKKRIKAEVAAYKLEQGCMDCGSRDLIAACYEFDHRPDEKKVEIVSRLKKNDSKSVLWDEIAKCDVVCANCHRIRTEDRRISTTE